MCTIFINLYALWTWGPHIVCMGSQYIFYKILYDQMWLVRIFAGNTSNMYIGNGSTSQRFPIHTTPTLNSPQHIPLPLPTLPNRTVLLLPLLPTHSTLTPNALPTHITPTPNALPTHITSTPNVNNTFHCHSNALPTHSTSNPNANNTFHAHSNAPPYTTRLKFTSRNWK